MRVAVEASEGTEISGVILASERFLYQEGEERGGLRVFDRRIPPNRFGVSWKERDDEA